MALFLVLQKNGANQTHRGETDKGEEQGGSDYFSIRGQREGAGDLLLRPLVSSVPSIHPTAGPMVPEVQRRPKRKQVRHRVCKLRQR